MTRSCWTSLGSFFDSTIDSGPETKEAGRYSKLLNVDNATTREIYELYIEFKLERIPMFAKNNGAFFSNSVSYVINKLKSNAPTPALISFHGQFKVGEPRNLKIRAPQFERCFFRKHWTLWRSHNRRMDFMDRFVSDLHCIFP